MEARKKKNQIRRRFSTIALCCLAILLCAAPALHADVDVPANETLDINYPVTGMLLVYGTANLRTGASAQYIYVQNEGTLNMYSGTIGPGYFINVSSGAVGMTVYGTEFAVDGYPCDYEEVTLTGGRGTLTGYYGDGSSIDLLILSDTPINLQPPPSSGLEEITIDIKPGGNPNNINLKSRGVVPVAVLTTEDFDASTIDPKTVLFAGAEPVRWTLCDVDDDGDKDILFHFKTEDLKLDDEITEATLTCEIKSEMTRETTDGEVIQGTDEVCIVPRKKK